MMRSVGPQAMKQTSSIKTSARKSRVVSSEDDAPPLTQANFRDAQYRVSGKDVTRVQWQEAVRARLGKQRISIMLDAPIIEHFKSVAGARGDQTLINDSLRRVVQGYFNYFAVPGNLERLIAYRHEVCRAWYHALRRRSQKGRVPWIRFVRLIDLYVPRVRQIHPHPLQRFRVIT